MYLYTTPVFVIWFSDIFIQGTIQFWEQSIYNSQSQQYLPYQKGNHSLIRVIALSY